MIKELKKIIKDELCKNNIPNCHNCITYKTDKCNPDNGNFNCWENPAVEKIADRIYKGLILGVVIEDCDVNELKIEENTYAHYQKVCCQCNMQQNDLNFLTRLLRFPKTLKVVGKIAKENKGIEPNILIGKISKYITDNNISPYRQKRKRSL